MGKYFIFLILFFLFESITHASHIFDAYRLVQYDHKDQMFGSRRTAMKLIASTALNMVEGEPTSTQNSLIRRVLISDILKLNSELILTCINDRQMEGLLILIPQDFTSYEEEEIKHIRELEIFLINYQFEIPIYFTYSTSYLLDLIAKLDIHENKQQFQLELLLPEEAKIIKTSSFLGINFHSFLMTSSPSMNGKVIPTIGIVADSDAWAVSPALATNAANSGTGLIALLEIARNFHRLFEYSHTQPSFNILFLITGAGKLNSLGASEWLKDMDPKLISSLDFVLCLDDIGQKKDLFLHVSRPPKESTIQMLYDTFVDVSKRITGNDIKVVHKKINITDPIIYWPHETFSRHRVFAATLSNDQIPPSPSFEFNSMVDSKKYIEGEKEDVFLSSQFDELPIATGTRQPSYDFLNIWLTSLNNTPHASPYTNIDSIFYTNIENIMKKHTSMFTKTSFPLSNSDYTFYIDPKANINQIHQISIYEVSSSLFDLFISLSIMLYLLIFRISLEMPTSIQQVINIFQLNTTKSRQKQS